MIGPTEGISEVVDTGVPTEGGEVHFQPVQGLLSDRDHHLAAACRAAQIHRFINSLPDGYESWVGETGVRLSGGRTLRIVIARARLRDAPILLLDGSTEGLDTETAHAVIESLEQLMLDRGQMIAEGAPSSVRLWTGTDLLHD